MSRLYARYLGGALDLVSLPGYGTHAYVNLPRVQTQQVEVVPASQLGLAALPLLRFKKAVVINSWIEILGFGWCNVEIKEIDCLGL